jgi:glycogen synthase
LCGAALGSRRGIMRLAAAAGGRPRGGDPVGAVRPDDGEFVERMRILHILDHSPPVQSGYVYRTLAILREQVAAGWQVLPLTTPKQPDASALSEIVEGWEFIRTPAPRTSQWLPQVASEYAMVRATIGRVDEIARAWRPDVLHAHSPVPNAWAALSVGRRLGVPVVYEIRALWEDAAASHGTMLPGSVRYAMARHLETRAAKRADAVVTICRGLYDDLRRRGVCRDNMFIVPNAADVGSLLADASHSENREAGPVIGFIGSFYSYEGLDLLVEAARELVRLRPEIRFVLVGGGPDEARLRELCRASGLGDRMSFSGWVPHDRIDAWYRQIDILVYPRKRNRLTEFVTPLKPLEAMAHAKVILASDVGGHRELIEDGLNGFLFRSDDAPDLLRRLLALLDARTAWPDTGARARRFVEEQRSWKVAAATYAQVYARARSERDASAASSNCSPVPEPGLRTISRPLAAARPGGRGGACWRRGSCARLLRGSRGRAAPR